MPDQYLQETGVWLQEHAGIRLSGSVSREELEKLLAAKLEMLVEKDFQQFVLLLYQVDVSEQKVKKYVPYMLFYELDEENYDKDSLAKSLKEN